MRKYLKFVPLFILISGLLLINRSIFRFEYHDVHERTFSPENDPKGFYPLGDFIAAHDNYKHCFGIIGSGNRNFNEQYCLTAKQYAKRFGFPMLGDFELRGTSADIERLAEIIVDNFHIFKHII